MNATLSFLIDFFAKAGMLALVVNEVRGMILAIPVLYTLYVSGGTFMAIWLAFSSLAGIALSVIAPLFVARKLRCFRDPDHASAKSPA